MKKKLARLVVIGIALTTCLSLLMPVQTSGSDIPTEPIVETAALETVATEATEAEPETEPTEETIIEEPVIIYEYPEAQQVWETLLSWGWTPEVCAGIIGNIMAEIGGGTLDFSDWDSNGGCGYGMIQWIGNRRKLIKSRYGDSPNIAEQLEYMRDEMLGTNNTPRQISEKIYNKIMNASTPEEAAFLFATYFERCHENYRAMRRGYARRAYDYFMN